LNVYLYKKALFIYFYYSRKSVHLGRKPGKVVYAIQSDKDMRMILRVKKEKEKEKKKKTN
jgi:hypothetical protein